MASSRQLFSLIDLTLDVYFFTWSLRESHRRQTEKGRQASPLLMVRKAGGFWHPCGDQRHSLKRKLCLSKTLSNYQPCLDNCPPNLSIFLSQLTKHGFLILKMGLGQKQLPRSYPNRSHATHPLIVQYV